MPLTSQSSPSVSPAIPPHLHPMRSPTPGPTDLLAILKWFAAEISEKFSLSHCGRLSSIGSTELISASGTCDLLSLFFPASGHSVGVSFRQTTGEEKHAQEIADGCSGGRRHGGSARCSGVGGSIAQSKSARRARGQ